MNSGTSESTAGKEGKREAKIYHFHAVLQHSGWISPAFVEVDEGGRIKNISQAPASSKPIEAVNGYALPGFQNAHSHAFQFAMAGMAEKHDVNAVDDFWSWREAMYACALTMDPDQMQAVAAMAYAEMLKRGYTHVAEFQYLHHDKDGKPYDNQAEMSVSLVAAAAFAGIKITLIPVFYQKGGFGKEADPAQRRFILPDVDEYLKLLSDCAAVVKDLTSANVGFGVHSLRAAATDDILRIVREGPANIPFHIHAAEQLKEVNDCLAFLNQRPVEWLLNNLDLNKRYHLIHCTHLTDNEVLGLAQSGANVVLCPGTEANLGDGIFRLTDFSRHSEHWSIGTDSHISLNPLEDLRWLDYTQRLTNHKRNTFADGATVLIRSTYFAGRSAMGLNAGDFFEVGKPLDAVVYRADSPLLNTAGVEHLLPTLVYTADGSSVLGTIVDGEWICRHLHHKHEGEILKNFQRALKDISSVL
ncbi:MAG: formimidoylglutamate deiminase [Cyclobacteriaceae bacterium]